MIQLDLETLNKQLRDKTPEEIIDWALPLTDKRVVTTSFGIYSAVLLSTFARKDPKIDVLWCDTLYNTPETYEHAKHLINRFELNVHRFTPLKSKSEIDLTIGVPSVEDNTHDEFAEVVKLEPFRRAMNKFKPEVWFTNIRVRQTEYRNSKDILSYSKDGVLKISPFYYWSDALLDAFLDVKQLPKNNSYFDPVKALQSRECGIHLQ